MFLAEGLENQLHDGGSAPKQVAENKLFLENSSSEEFSNLS